MSEILVGVGASAACFKAVALCSLLSKEGHGVQAVLTRNATKLVQPLQFSCVTGRRALTDEWEPLDPAGMDHIALARRADLLLICPATAHLLGALAHGLAEDLIGSLALAIEPRKPRLIAPAMNPEMWANPLVQRNARLLAEAGWKILGPAEGATACGESGAGRMLEPEAIAAAVRAALTGAR
jgi:phosphopantothenoylcysteine decarboxylase/phosphopantothenate--cysteine ligase